ncbi:glycosyltransferase family 2 protein [Chitinophaga lutea]
MVFWSLLFWTSAFFVLYTYIGYAILLYIAVRVKRVFFPVRTLPENFTPPVTFMVAAYNEESFIEQKIQNSLQLDYPADKLQLVIVTDGSSDGTNDVIRRYPQIRLLHKPERKGKTMAINRAMETVDTPFVVFSDANTFLNPQAVRKLIAHFADETTGAVAGEKKVISQDAQAEGVGEGLYWKYESALKRWDASLYSVMGAAGELFALRTSLYEHVHPDTILDDFMISFGVNRKGYTVQYAPDAFAMESPSASLADEYKRKVRISAGGFQSIAWLAPLLNVFRYPRIWWQYVSHRVFRWTLAPLGLLLALIANVALVAMNAGGIYTLALMLQALFYGAALTGYVLARRQIKVKYFYVPFYFVFMNVAVFHGFFRFLGKRQSAAWDRSQRQSATAPLS